MVPRLSGDSFIETGELIDGVPNTFEAWIKVAGSHPDGRVGVIAGNYESGHSSGTINWEIHTRGRLRIYWDEGNPNLISDRVDVRTGEWEHVAFVRDTDAGKIKFYLNGELADSFSNTGSGVKLGEHPANNLLRIGSDYPSRRQPFSGLISDVRIWEIARTESEIRGSMKQNSLRGDEKGLIGYWPLDEEKGDIVRDLSKNENHGRIIGEYYRELASPFVKDLQPEVIDASTADRVRLGPVELRAPQGDVTYQWYRNQKPIEGETASTLTISGPTASDTGTYHVEVNDERDSTPISSGGTRLGWPDWPMWRYDSARSAETPLELAGELHLQWVRQLPEPRRAWLHQFDHRGKLDFDVSYAPVVTGRRVFVPSSVTDSLTSYCIEDGSELWRFYADGPVRLAPAAWRDNVFFVSDDGHLYCLDAESGELNWKFRGGPSDHRLLGNERVINFWAARGGPVVEEGKVYFAAGLWPLHGVFIYALDAESGRVVWVNDTISSDYVRLPHGAATGYGGIAPQGYLAVSGDRLVVAGGRTTPAVLDRRTGELKDADFRAKGDGNYAVHGLDGGGLGMRRNSMIADRADALSDLIEGEVFYKLAAHDRLLLSTEEGVLYCFGPQETEVIRYGYEPAALNPQAGDWSDKASELLERLGGLEGYALVLGAGSGDLLKEILLQSDFHAVVVEIDAERVLKLRNELAGAGMYGRCVAVIEADPSSFSVQPYLFSLVVSESAEDAGINPCPDQLAAVLDLLKPYGGLAFLGVREDREEMYFDAAEAAGVDRVTPKTDGGGLYARRCGPLTGAGEWTHQYSDSSNTNFSPDSLVRAPLGVLWFGGSSNHGVLPRHGGHGPTPQVTRGVLIMPGVDDIRARCVYTGRELWKRKFPGIGHPFTNLELEKRFDRGESVFMVSRSGVGAVQLGSPFVSRPDGIYVRYKTRIYRINPESGELDATFQLPVRSEFEGRPDWGHISISGDLIITTIEPQVFGQAGDYTTAYDLMQDIVRSSRFEPPESSFDEDAWDGTSSKQVLVMDRHSGDVLWTRRAEVGFRHNAVTSGSERLYLVDGLSSGATERLQRRGAEPADAALLALDLHTGEPVWERDTGIFGTWLCYSEQLDTLIEGGRPASGGGRSTLPDEPNDRIAAYRGSDGEALWQTDTGRYSGPISIRGDKIYLAPSGSSGRGRALNLANGEPIKRESAHTAKSADWSYSRRYGCNSHNVSEHLITFRSGYAAYYDLKNDSGTGFLAGFRSGCTNNLIAGDGVLNAPDYTRSCTCSYAHQTSLALIHMPDDPNVEFWTRYDGAFRAPEGFGINYGAPGRRVNKGGRDVIWHDEPGSRRRHPSAVEETGAGISWVAASVREGEGDIVIGDLLEKNYTVRFHFAELDETAKRGDRVFDVLIDGEKVLSGFDILKQAQAPLRGLVKEFSVDVEGSSITVEMRRCDDSKLEPVISGIELKLITASIE